MKNRIKDVLLALAEAKVSCVIAGGVAAVLHGVERLTMDIDLALDPAPENVRRFLSVMDKFHMTPRVPVPGDVLADRKAVRKIVKEKNAIVFTFVNADLPIIHVDVFLKEDLSFTKLKRHTVTMRFGRTKLTILSARKLLKLKQGIFPPRDKDRQDIETLTRLLTGKRT